MTKVSWQNGTVTSWQCDTFYGTSDILFVLDGTGFYVHTVIVHIQTKMLILKIFDHAHSLIIDCAVLWVNEMKLFHKKALFVSSLGVSLGSAALSLYWSKNVNFEDGDVKEHLSFHWHLFFTRKLNIINSRHLFSIFLKMLQLLQYDWKAAPSPASRCPPLWSAAASSASPRRCSWHGAACGCGCWRSGQVSTVSQPQQSPH